jgi:hypothetical protein
METISVETSESESEFSMSDISTESSFETSSNLSFIASTKSSLCTEDESSMDTTVDTSLDTTIDYDTSTGSNLDTSLETNFSDTLYALNDKSLDVNVENMIANDQHLALSEMTPPPSPQPQTPTFEISPIKPRLTRSALKVSKKL